LDGWGKKPLLEILTSSSSSALDRKWEDLIKGFIAARFCILKEVIMNININIA